MEVKTKQRLTIAGELPLKDGDDLLSRLDQGGVPGATAIRILRGLDQIIKDNNVGTTAIRLLVEVSSDGKVRSELGLQSKDFVETGEFLAKPVGILNLSTRVESVLSHANIKTVGELCAKTEKEIARYRNMGRKSVREIKLKLMHRGLSLVGGNTSP
jgi:DNA-directed RNA polymerase alpha subunit